MTGLYIYIIWAGIGTLSAAWYWARQMLLARSKGIRVQRVPLRQWAFVLGMGLLLGPIAALINRTGYKNWERTLPKKR